VNQLVVFADRTHALIAAVGERASYRFFEFFTANIRNPNTRRAYAWACRQFFAWCEDRGLTLTTIRPFDVASYVELLQRTHGQVAPANPASAVRGPKHVVKTGKTPVLDAADWRKLLDAIPTDTVRDLRDRALIATLTYSFARITAALNMKVEDLRPQGAGWRLRLHEKGGKHHAMPCHHALVEALHAYIGRRRHRRGPQGMALPDEPWPRRHCVVRRADEPIGRMALIERALSGRHHHARRQPHLSRHGRHRLPEERRHA